MKPLHGLLSVLSVGTLLMLVACGGGSGGGNSNNDGADVSHVTARLWQPLLKLSDNRLNTALNSADTVFDDDGNGFAVWTQSTGYPGNIQQIVVRRYLADEGWVAPVVIANTVTISAPRIAVDAAGNAMVIWMDVPHIESSGGWLLFSRYTPTTGWSMPAMVPDTDDALSNNLQLLMDDAGNALAVFIVQTDEDCTVNGTVKAGCRADYRLSRYTNDEGWAELSTLISDGSRKMSIAYMAAMNRAGDAVLAWKYSSAEQAVVVRNFSMSSGLDDNHWWLSTDSTSTAQNVQAAIDNNGNAMVGWQDNTSGEARINLYKADEGWFEAISLTQTGSLQGLAFNNNGGAVAIWLDSGDLWAKHYNTDGSWGSPVQLENSDASVSSARLVKDRSGNYLLTLWRQGTALYGRSHVKGITWTAADSVAIPLSGNFSVAVNEQGNAIATATVSDGKNYQLHTGLYGEGVWRLMDIEEDDETLDSKILLTQTGLADDKSATQTLAFNVPYGAQWLDVSLTDGNGDVDMAVTVNGEVCASHALGNEEFCRLEAPAPGQGAVTLYGAESYSDVSLTVTAYGDQMGSWQAPVTIGSAGYGVYSPRLLKNTQGDIVAVWYQDDTDYTGGYSLVVSAYLGDDNWQTPQKLAVSELDFPDLRTVLDNNGNVLFVWPDANDEVNGVVWHKDTGWQTVRNLETPDYCSRTLRLQMTMDSQGNAMAVWLCLVNGGGSYVLRFNRYLVVGGWQTPATIEYPVVGNNLSMVAGANGNVLLLNSASGTTAAVSFLRYSNGLWLDEADPAGSPAGYGAYSRWGIPMVVDTDGNATVILKSEGAITSEQYVPGAGWSLAKKLTGNVLTEYAPQIVQDDVGNLLLLWSEVRLLQPDGATLDIWSHRYIVGAGWQPAQLVQGNADGLTAQSKLFGDNDGNAFALWRRQVSESQSEPWISYFNSNKGWGVPVMLAWHFEEIVFDANDSVMAIMINGKNIQISYFR